MNLRFWYPFFISGFACLLIAFFAGFFLTKTREVKLERSLLKKTIKLESLLYLEQLNEKLGFLIKEGERIQREEKILSDSPFFALVVNDKSKAELETTIEAKKIYIAEDQFPLNIINQKQGASAVEKQTEEQSGFELEKRKTLIELSKKASLKLSAKSFWFKSLKVVGQKQPLIAFIKPLDEDTQWIAFLKEDKGFFKLLTAFPKKKTDKNKEVFAMNSQGQLFFHTKASKILKHLSKKSPLWTSFEKRLKKPSEKDRYIQSHQRAGKKEMYYLHKWDGNLFLISKTDFSLPFFYFGELSFQGRNFCFLIFFLVFVFFFVKLFSLISAYNFLKFAFLSFGRTEVFPSTDNLKNPLLYFYNNRQVFFNQREMEEEEEQEEKRSLNFREIIVQETEKLKLKFPNLSVNTKFDFDVKVFGFERFLRNIIQELLLNALEAMGGLKEPRIDLSTKEQGENFVFCVKDYGVGVSDQNYERLFRIYYSTKSQMGVGLNLVQSIVKSNEGSIELSSPKNGGLEVCISLPLKCFLKNHSKT